jgi:PAS domain S-box-containing protein
MDGMEVCRQIKANPETTHLMVLHVTASSVTSTDRTLGLEKGADGYLLEPVEPPELVASVRALLRLYDREQENRRLLAQLRHITESGITGVAFFNTSGLITDANQAFLDMIGYGIADLKAGLLHWDALTPPEWMPRTRQAVEEFHATGRITPYEKQYIRRDGQRLWGLFGGARIGRSDEGIALVLDISARKRSDHALRESEERLRLALESSALGSGKRTGPTDTARWIPRLPRYWDGLRMSISVWSRPSTMYIRKTGHHSAIN